MSSLVRLKTTASGYLMNQVLMVKKNSRETKNGHSTFHTGKPGNFNSLREVI